MNADTFRHFYGYHFAENRKLWDAIMVLSREQYIQEASYAHGSVRNQIVHIASVENRWFSGLRGVEVPAHLDPSMFDDREKLRAQWDQVEQNMRVYLAYLRDEMLLHKLSREEAKSPFVWQVLLQVANHGTDHRAQILRTLSDLGVKTGPQDYIFYVFETM